jgi:hypothetical protein
VIGKWTSTKLATLGVAVSPSLPISCASKGNRSDGGIGFSACSADCRTRRRLQMALVKMPRAWTQRSHTRIDAS